MGAKSNAEFPGSFCHVVVAVVGRGIQSNHIQFAAELRLIIKDARERTRQLAASTRAGNEQPGQSRGSRERVHRLSALQKSDADSLWRGPKARHHADDRRATGRLERCRRKTV